MRKVEVLPYSPSWETEYKKESSRLADILDRLLIDIHHIGSTSVRGLAAKPVIDLLPVVTDLSLVDDYNEKLIEIGYEPKGENGIEGRRYFQKGGDMRTHHVHIYESGDPEIERHLNFRDYLISHPQKAEEYSQLKGELARKYPWDITSYIEGKHALAKEIDALAQAWDRCKKAHL
ncbi:GrpB family protein [Fictibacillus fluitans]|uniref:GrpB family protein n=1 Tax=Fictibacillus fluitans TaxID=3058422 RepID=A0ABT8HQP2_9BACL|nr:GrpB family protein [Fictibacillus sp. NE201]MDN4523095.1 GrpB family protein [Fictibacillus sp. NE201]